MFWFKNKKQSGMVNKTEEEKDTIMTKQRITRMRNQRLLQLEQRFEAAAARQEESELMDEIHQIEADLEQPETEQSQSPLSGGSVEDMLMSQILNKVMQPKTQSSFEHLQPPQQPHTPIITDEQLQEFIGTIDKKQLKIFKKLDIDTQKNMIKAKFPNLDDETINRGITIMEGV